MALLDLIPALLDFERSPGRWPLSRREPALLFNQTHTLLLLAAGRPVQGLDAWDTSAQTQARQAARFFVRTALLRPGSDAYTVLGLSRSVDAESVRTHYRLMIRLTHPDFAGADNEWPSDAATRINLANDVLSSAVRRADLDKALAATEAEAAQAERPTLRRYPAAAKGVVLPPTPMWAHSGAGASGSGRAVPRTFEPMPTLKMAGLALGAVMVLGVFVLVNPASEDRSLVARHGVQRHPLANQPDATSTSLAAQADQYRPVPTEGRPANLPLLPAVSDPLQPNTAASALTQMVDVAPEANPVPAALPPKRLPRLVPADRGTKGVPPQTSRTASLRTVQAPVAPAPTTLLSTPATKSESIAAPAAPPSPPPSSSLSTAQVSTAAVVPPEEPRPLKLAEVQPLLAKIEQTAQRGLGVPLAMLIHPSRRKAPGAQQFVFDFQDSLAGYRVSGLSRTDIHSREIGDQLDVDMRMQFTLEDQQGSSLSRNVAVQARFGRIDDKVALVRMTLLNPGGGR